MSKYTAENLFELFKKQYQRKYDFLSDTPLGDGGYGIVYKAKDKDRNVDVAIKLFHDGAVPEGSERGWHVTSKIIHHQVGPTFTVEQFTDEQGLFYRAVVSRFIPGKPLGELFKKWNHETDEYKKIISRDFSKTLIPSLIDVLEACHSFGFGHGDLHEGNVMVIPNKFGEQNRFAAVLIDFDNASIKPDLVATTEKGKMEKDLRLLKRMIGYIIMEWNWSNQMEPICTSYNTAADLKYAWNSALQFINLIDDGEFDQPHIYEHIKSLTIRALGGFNIQPQLATYRNIAATIGQSELFEAAFDQWMKRIYEPGAFTSSVSIEIIQSEEMDLYKRLFDS